MCYKNNFYEKFLAHDDHILIVILPTLFTISISNPKVKLPFPTNFGRRIRNMATTSLHKNIIVKIGGFTNGMTIEAVKEHSKQIADFYEPRQETIYAFTWDGDPFKLKGSNLDESRGTPGCFTHALGLLRKRFPEIPFVAAKREDQLDKLTAKYHNITKHGSIEGGCEEIFGPLLVVAKLGSEEVPELQVNNLNVLTAPADTHWAKLGVENILFWKNTGFEVHYVTIGGGDVVTKELEQVGDQLQLLWRLPTSRLSPTEGNPPDVVEFQFVSKDPNLKK